MSAPLYVITYVIYQNINLKYKTDSANVNQFLNEAITNLISVFLNCIIYH